MTTKHLFWNIKGTRSSPRLSAVRDRNKTVTTSSLRPVKRDEGGREGFHGRRSDPQWGKWGRLSLPRHGERRSRKRGSDVGHPQRKGTVPTEVHVKTDLNSFEEGSRLTNCGTQASVLVSRTQDILEFSADNGSLRLGLRNPSSGKGKAK